MYWLELQDNLYLIRCFKDPSDKFFVQYFVSFVHLNARSTTRNKLLIKFSKTSHSQYSYFNRVPRLWNSLPPLELSLSFNTIKLHLKQLFWKHFIVHFNPTNLFSFHILCQCLNCVNSNHSVSCNYNTLQQHLFFAVCLSALLLPLSFTLFSLAYYITILLVL